MDQAYNLINEPKGYEKKESTVEILGSTYIIDEDAQCLRRQDDPATIIEFGKLGAAIQLRVSGDHAFSDALLADKTESEMARFNDALQRRLTGELPTVKIFKDQFDVRLKDDLLVLKQDPSKTIELGAMNRIGYPESKYFGFYHTQEKKIIKIDPSTMTKLPKGVVLLEIPPPEKIDPIGYSLLHGLPVSSLVKHSGIELEHVGKTKELKNTSLPFYIEQNLKTQKVREKTDREKIKRPGGRKL